MRTTIAILLLILPTLLLSCTLNQQEPTQDTDATVEARMEATKETEKSVSATVQAKIAEGKAVSATVEAMVEEQSTPSPTTVTPTTASSTPAPLMVADGQDCGPTITQPTEVPERGIHRGPHERASSHDPEPAGCLHGGALEPRRSERRPTRPRILCVSDYETVRYRPASYPDGPGRKRPEDGFRERRRKQHHRPLEQRIKQEAHR